MRGRGHRSRCDDLAGAAAPDVRRGHDTADPYGNMQRKTRDGRSMKAEAAAFIKPNDRLTSFERLEIYNRQYWFRILSAFAEDFPDCRSGRRRGLRKAHARVSFGSPIAVVHAAQPWLAARELASCASEHAGKRLELALDVVRLEWAYIEAFDNAEERALTLADLGQLDGESQLSLQPHSATPAASASGRRLRDRCASAQGSQSVASNAVTEVKHARSRRVPALKRKRDLSERPSLQQLGLLQATGTRRVRTAARDWTKARRLGRHSTTPLHPRRFRNESNPHASKHGLPTGRNWVGSAATNPRQRGALPEAE